MSTAVNTSDKSESALKRYAVLVYGGAAYALFLAVLLYAVGFVGNFGVPKSLDSAAQVSWQAALATDLALLTLFALQHSVMARRGFKRLLIRFIPAAAERSTYVAASSLALALLFWKWEPLGGTIWQVENSVGAGLLHAAYGFGWVLVLVSTFAINHFDLFGLRQVWTQWRERPEAPLRFSTPFLYRMVRHPLYLGWLFVFWSTPNMTVSHLFFAAMTTAYILIAIRFEEADLIREHPEYSVYRTRVPMLLPRLTGAVRPPEAPARTQTASPTSLRINR